MKLSNPIVVKSAALVTSGLIRAWLGTLDLRIVVDDPASDPLRSSRPNLYLFWHEMLLLPAHAYSRFRIAMLIGRHRDGELIAQVLRMLRGVSIRGSTDHGRNRGGVSALRAMIGCGRAAHLAVTPDGPRGPRRVVQEGVVYLASRASVAIVPAGGAFERPWRAGSWDRMALPRPFSRARIVIGSPITVPDGLDRDALASHVSRVQEAMDDVQDRAERLAAGDDSARGPARMVSAAVALRWPDRRGRLRRT